MFAWVEVTREERGKKEISYSLGHDLALDGKIAYDSRTGKIELVKLSDGASPQATRDFMDALKDVYAESQKEHPKMWEMLEKYR